MTVAITIVSTLVVWVSFDFLAWRWLKRNADPCPLCKRSGNGYFRETVKANTSNWPTIRP